MKGRADMRRHIFEVRVITKTEGLPSYKAKMDLPLLLTSMKDHMKKMVESLDKKGKKPPQWNYTWDFEDRRQVVCFDGFYYDENSLVHGSAFYVRTSDLMIALVGMNMGDFLESLILERIGIGRG
jgi:hypothetical protein